MLEAVIQSPIFWGFAGAFMYGVNDVLACLFESRAAGKWPCVRCVLEFAAILAVGAIAAAAFTPWMLDFLGRTDGKSATAAAAITGYVANRVLPDTIGVARKWMNVAKGSQK